MTEDHNINELLKAKLYKLIKEINLENIGIAFSGGVDSSLLAKIGKDVGKNVTLLTVSFLGNKDVNFSSSLSEILKLPILTKIIKLEELEKGVKVVLSKIEFERIARLENCISFYYVFKLASNNGLENVISANGMDELFCGYDVYKRNYTKNKRELMILMNELVETAKADKKEIDKLASLFNIRYYSPFLSKDFISFSKKIGLSYKIKNKEDILRKHVLREIALRISVPKMAALRPKKAFQYSSGLHKALLTMAKKNGFTRSKTKKMGYQSILKAYINHLKKIINMK
jgi:asparagine synthase (glutamine-hydrolysing)